MSGSWDKEDLPNLNHGNHQITSPCTPRYNCIVWAAGEDDRWWWPKEYGFWPRHAPREETIDAFALAFEILGYRECRDGSLEVGYEKIALYATKYGNTLKPTHASRQLSDGRWTSKLGRAEDIVHETAQDVNGRVYGEPIRFMRRAI